MTLDEHVHNLAKYCAETDDEQIIKKTILDNLLVIDDDSLLSYDIIKDELCKYVMVLFASGDGRKTVRWMKEIARQNGCKCIRCLSKRAKALERKYSFKPIATYMEMEV